MHSASHFVLQTYCTSGFELRLGFGFRSPFAWRWEQVRRWLREPAISRRPIPQVRVIRCGASSKPATSYTSILQAAPGYYDRANPEHVAIAERVLDCIDDSELPAFARTDRAGEAAVCLKEILDRVELPPWDQIPDMAEIVAAGGREKIASLSNSGHQNHDFLSGARTQVGWSTFSRPAPWIAHQAIFRVLQPIRIAPRDRRSAKTSIGGIYPHRAIPRWRALSISSRKTCGWGGRGVSPIGNGLDCSSRSWSGSL